MLSGPRRKFCEGIVSGLTATEAYRAAYPNTTPDNARKNAAKLSRRDDVKAEIAELRAKGDEKAGSAVLTYAEKREFFAELVRARAGLLPHNSPLWQSIKYKGDGVEYRLPDKLKAIELDNDLAGDGKEATVNDELAELLGKIRQAPGAGDFLISRIIESSVNGSGSLAKIQAAGRSSDILVKGI